MKGETMTCLRILHLSDTHLLAGAARHEGLVDTVAALRFTLAGLENAGQLDLVVASGDVSDDGSVESYSTLNQLIGDFAARHGAAVVYAMGNHDQRAGFWEVLGTGHDPKLAPSAVEPVKFDGGPITGVSLVNGFKVISLDSSVPGRTHGFLDEDQLQWLRTVSQPSGTQQLAPNGSIVVVHHPPVPPVTPLHHGIELQNPQDLARALEGSDVVAIFSGHYHHPLVDSLVVGPRRIPAIVAGGVVNSNDLLARPGHERATAGGNASLVTLEAPKAAVAANVRVAPLRITLPANVSPPEIFDLDKEKIVTIAAAINAPGYRMSMPPTSQEKSA